MLENEDFLMQWMRRRWAFILSAEYCSSVVLTACLCCLIHGSEYMLALLCDNFVQEISRDIKGTRIEKNEIHAGENWGKIECQGQGDSRHSTCFIHSTTGQSQGHARTAIKWSPCLTWITCSKICYHNDTSAFVSSPYHTSLLRLKISF